MIKITSHIFLYIFAFLLSVYLLITAVIRIKMRFWHTQPVFHIYNLKYWINPPGFINKEPPPVNKFVNLTNNKLITLDSDINVESSTPYIKEICKFSSCSLTNNCGSAKLISTGIFNAS